MRRAGKVDANQGEIVKALRRVGCSVYVASGVGDGFPDLLVRPRGGMASLILMECKVKKGKLTPAQVDFLSAFPETLQVRSVEEALRAVGVRI